MSGRIIPIGGPLVPPTRYRLWVPGDNPGDYGSNVLTSSALSRVMGAYQKRGAALAIDFQHATNPKNSPDPAKPPPMAGYAEMTEEDGCLWLDPIRWSDCGRAFAVPGEVCCGKHQIETGQRNYLSPDWFIDKDTREPISIERLSLVSEPGTYNVNMLAAKASQGTRNDLNMNDIEILKALLAAAMGCASCADPDCQALGVTVSQTIQDFAQGKGMDLSAPTAGEAPVDAAACGPDKLQASSADVAQQEKPQVMASKGAMTEDRVRAIIAEDAERRSLIEANKGILGGMVSLLASKPLTEVKAFVAAANERASKASTVASPRGAEIGGEDTGKSYSLADRYSKKDK